MLNMKLVGIMHVKNAIQTIEECLEKLSSLADEIIVVDNGSTDGTLAVYQKFPKIVKLLHTEGYHGGRDVRLLLEEAKKRNPDWILLIDSDEVFETHLTRDTLERYMKSQYDIIYFRMYNFWLNKREFRIDREWLLYTLVPQRHMFRNLPDIYFRDIKVHYGPVQGISGPVSISPYRIKHYGYSYREEIERKMQMYRDVDAEKNYTHLNPDSGRIITVPFVEFRNRLVNSLFIRAQDVFMRALAFLITFKRKYFHEYKFFEQ